MVRQLRPFPGMNRHKRWLLHLYYYGSLPYRRCAGWWRVVRSAAPVMILFYHRVADSVPNDWTMTNRQFVRQIDWLRQRFDLVSLAEAQRRIRSDGTKRPSVSITFDDGYADNCHTALPLLMREGIPCTYFVSTHHVLGGLPFPHDVAAGQPLRTNTLAQLKTLSAAGVEIGAHTRSHADLGSITDRTAMLDEMVTCRRELQTALDRPVRYFAFPYGQRENMTPAALGLAKEAGYHGVCSVYGGYNLPGGDPFHLRRIHGDPEFIRLKNWLSVDPRKSRQVPQPTQQWV